MVAVVFMVAMVVVVVVVVVVCSEVLGFASRRAWTAKLTRSRGFSWRV